MHKYFFTIQQTFYRRQVCGPRWVNNVTNGNKSNWYMNGICYKTLAINANAFEREAEQHVFLFTSPETQITLKNNQCIYNNAFGQAGFSLHMTSLSAADVAIGSPGVYDWEGHVKLFTLVNGSFHRAVISSFKEQQVHSYFGKDIFFIAIPLSL